MRLLQKLCAFTGLTLLGVVPTAHAYGPGNPATYNAVPPGFTFCANDNAVCRVPAGATVYVVWGADTRYATAVGQGDFTCLPKGWGRQGMPRDLGVNDPASGVAKKCYIKTEGGSAPAPTPAPTAAPAPASAPASAPAPAQAATGIPAGAAACVTDGGTCRRSGAWTGVYGVNGRFVNIAGSGDFVCLPDRLRVADPAPGVQKTCYVTGGSATTAAPAPAPTPATAPTQTASSSTGVPGCNAFRGTIYNAAAKQYTTMAALNGNYANNVMLQTNNPVAECAQQCGRTGEPAPCAWFTVTQWLSSLTGSRQSSTTYVCHMFNDRSLRQITTPNLPRDRNLGAPDSPTQFRGAASYACRS